MYNAGSLVCCQFTVETNRNRYDRRFAEHPTCRTDADVYRDVVPQDSIVGRDDVYSIRRNRMLHR